MTKSGTDTARAMILPLALAQLIGRFPMRRAGGLRGPAADGRPFSASQVGGR